MKNIIDIVKVFFGVLFLIWFFVYIFKGVVMIAYIL